MCMCVCVCVCDRKFIPAQKTVLSKSTVALGQTFAILDGSYTRWRSTWSCTSDVITRCRHEGQAGDCLQAGRATKNQ